MALTPSNMLPLGTKAPAFELIEPLSGKSRSLEELAGSAGTLVMFICNHCPFVLHVESQLIALARDYQARGIGVIAISANDALSHPQDGPEAMAQRAREKGYPFPYLYDESQIVAKAYDAACTPDFFLFGPDLRCVYRGQLDQARPGNEQPNDGADLRAAMDALLAGKAVNPLQKPSMGCNIKWRATA